MDPLVCYIPIDKREALAGPHVDAPTDSVLGAVLFADISGFTPLTEALTRRYGARRGADELVRQINRVYDSLIDKIHRYGGSVIGFSGDAITCWFDAGEIANQHEKENALQSAAERAFWSACFIQQAMHNFEALEVTSDAKITLAVKTSVASGQARRYLVGDPEIQVIDVLAGRLLDRMAAGEQIAEEGETVLDEQTALLLSKLLDPTTDSPDLPLPKTQRKNDFTILSAQEALGFADVAPPSQQMVQQDFTIPEERLRPWLLPTIYQRLRASRNIGHDRYLAEMRPATALFVRFSGLEYDNDADAGLLLDRYIRWAQRLLQRYGGSLIQITTGDKGSYFYATFGAPIAHEDDAARAAAAAVELLRPPAELAAIQEVQIGIAQGRMRVGAYGSQTRRTYGVIGDATNLSARLMVHAQPGEILISGEITEEIGQLYQLDDLGLVRFKGKGEAQQVYRVRRHDHQTHANQFQALYTEPLVGRDPELAQLDELIASVKQNGVGRILRIEGDAGVGKSHLAAIATERAESNHLAMVLGACQSTGRDTAYAPLRQIVRHLLHLPPTAQDSHEQQTQIEQIHATVERMNPEWLLRLPLLGDLLGLPIPDNATTGAFDAQLRQEALTALTLELLRAGPNGQPYLLLVEDVHWIDESSQNILVALGRIIAETSVLLLLVHRPQLGDHSQQNDQFLREIAELPVQTALVLDELSPKGSNALVQNRVHGSVTKLALDLIYAQAQGNPFFTEELVDTLVESGRLTHQAGEWTLAPSMIDALHAAGCLSRKDGDWILAPDAALSNANLGVPDTVHGIVLSRLDRLPEAVKLTVKVASVIGRIFDFDLLAQAHPEAQIPDILLQQIGTLENRDFAQIEKPPPNHSYIFKHNITQEVVYGTLLDAQRKELHLRVAETLEAQNPEEAESLAHHFYNSDLGDAIVREKALDYLDAAGQRAKRDYANETALSYFARALQLDERWQWLKDKAEVLHILGRRDEEKEALEALESIPDTPPFDVAFLRGEFYAAESSYDKAQQALEVASNISNSIKDQKNEAICLFNLGMVAWRQGDYPKAENAYLGSLSLLSNNVDWQDEIADIRYGLGLLYRQQGTYSKAKQEFSKTLHSYQLQQNRQGEGKTLTALGSVAHLERDYESASHYHGRAVKIRRSIGDRSGEGDSLLHLAQIIRDTGDFSHAEIVFRKSLAIHQATNNRWSEANVQNELGILYLFVGEWSKAFQCLDQARRLCQEIDTEIGMAHVLCNLGQVMYCQQDFEQAQMYLERGHEIAESLGNQHIQEQYLTEFSILNLQKGDYVRAIEFANLSKKILLDMNLEVLTTITLAILAHSHFALGDRDESIKYARLAVRILDEHKGIGPDFPQRDYLFCSQVFSNMGCDAEARTALQSAYDILTRKVSDITDPNFQHSFLTNVQFNCDIVKAAEKQGLSSSSFLPN